jgi:hypothetical protein
MSNKKRAIEKANILLERRYLIEATTGETSTSVADADGNKWYVDKVPNSNPAKYRIYVELKGETGVRTDGLEIEKKNPELWKKVSEYKDKYYFGDYEKEGDAKYYLNVIVTGIQSKKTGGTSGTAGLLGTNGTAGSYISNQDIVKSVVPTFDALYPSQKG